MFILAISCLFTSNLPSFMDLDSCLGSFEGGHHYLHYSTIVWPQVNSREGTHLHPSTENWIKDLLSMAPPIRTRPSFPLSQCIPSESFHKPLILLHESRSMNQGKLEVVKQEMARVNINILGISELKWNGMGEFNSDDHEI